MKKPIGFIKLMYKMNKITAEEVWALVDGVTFTEEQAFEITGFKPKGV